MVKHKQKGAGLLGFMLIIIVGLSYYLIRDMNENVRNAVIGTDTIRSLSEAKEALKAWAVNHPFNPGTMPMPDRNGDGDYDGDSDCFNGTIGNNLLVGRIPWRATPSPCKDAASLSGLRVYLTDSAGEQLWYAVSKNLVYESPDYPDISLDILGRTTGWITVRDPGGNVISDRVAFVVISPGVPVGNQDRTWILPAPPPGPTNYLDTVTVGGTTYSNADFDQDFIIYPDSNLTPDPTDHFNDRLMFVTIDELMQGVSRRVLNETGNFLTKYHCESYSALPADCTNNSGAYPWLSPYADPKALAPVLNGKATADSLNTLNDSSMDFSAAGVRPGDTVRNLTDGSIGIVATVGTNSLTVASLILGTENEFDTDDIYYINRISSNYITSVLQGTAGIGSGGNTLADSGQDFIETGIQTGDVVENISDGSSGVIADVSTTALTVRSLSGGNVFNVGETYQIRTNMGRATAGSNGQTLIDANKDFQKLGIRSGDVIRNITDGSSGIISAVPGATTLTVSGLILGSENDFDENDAYIISRFNTAAGTTEGLLAFHQPGSMFSSSFTVDWNMQAANNISISTSPGTILTTYANKITADIETPAAGVNVSAGEGFCIWMTEKYVECYGRHNAGGLMLDGIVTSGSNTATFVDSTQNFISQGVKKGDIIQNYDDETTVSSGTADAGSNGTTLIDTAADFSAYQPAGLFNLLIINNTQTAAEGVDKIQGVVTEIIDANTLLVAPFPNDIPISFSPGDSYSLRAPQTMVITNVVSSNTLTTASLTGPAPDFDVNEYYRIKPAATGIDGTAAPGSNNNNLVDTFDLALVNVGDIIENVDDGSFGIINSVTSTTLTANLTGGTQNKFNNGDQYSIYTSYVNNRFYEFNLRFNGEVKIESPNGVRKRNICLGYGSDCSSAPSNTALAYNSGIATVSFVDYDDNENEVARASAVIQSSGSTGSIRVSGIDYYLSEVTNEIPEWFIRNKWYQYIHVSYSDGDVPGNPLPPVCTAGTDCLVLNLFDSTPAIVASRNDIRAVIMFAGSELSTQSRNNGAVTDYFDVAGNTDGADDNYDRMLNSGTFNDLLKIAITCPSDPAKLCWSD